LPLARRPRRAAAILLLTLAACSGPSYDLRPRLEPGELRRYALLHSVSEHDGQAVRFVETGAVLATTVSAPAGDGSLVLRTVLERARVRTAGRDERATELETRAFTIAVAARAERIAVAGLDGPQAGADALTDDGLAALLRVLIPTAPPSRVARGDRWEATSRVRDPLLGAAGVRARYEVLGRESRAGRDCVKLGVELELRPDSGIRVGAGAARGTLWLDRHSGWPAFASVATEITVESETGGVLRVLRHDELLLER